LIWIHVGQHFGYRSEEPVSLVPMVVESHFK